MTASEEDLSEELAGLTRLTTNQLCDRYAALFGSPARTRHKAYLVRKLAWRIQARAEGDLSDRARRRAAELADDADVRVMPPKAPAQRSPAHGGGGTRMVKIPTSPPATDPRLPPVGTVIARPYKGRVVRVVVRPDGFEHDGERYKTLTAVAEKVTGSHLNGFRFFRLDRGAKV